MNKSIQKLKTSMAVRERERESYSLADEDFACKVLFVVVHANKLNINKRANRKIYAQSLCA